MLRTLIFGNNMVSFRKLQNKIFSDEEVDASTTKDTKSIVQTPTLHKTRPK